MFGLQVWCAGLVCMFDVQVWCAGLVCRIGVQVWCAGLVCRFGVQVWCAGLVCRFGLIETNIHGKELYIKLVIYRDFTEMLHSQQNIKLDNGIYMIRHNMVFIYCSWVSTRWQRSVDLDKNRKKRAIYKGRKINETKKEL